jgi:DNA-binding NarL/FixJ family response regulator
LLIADHSPTRLGIRIALESSVHICAEANDAEQAIAAAGREQPDVCLVGLEVPGGGIAAARGIRAVSPRSAVIVLATSQDVDDLLASVQAGAIGYVLSDIDPASLRRTVAAVWAGEAAVPRAMVPALLRELRHAPVGSNGLTVRQDQVLVMLRRGRSTAAIAEELGISPVTVRRHISATVQKFGAADRTALARGAAEH